MLQWETLLQTAGGDTTLFIDLCAKTQRCNMGLLMSRTEILAVSCSNVSDSEAVNETCA